MKNLTLKGLLLIIASGFLFVQCTTDPIPGPQGLAGIDGTDGIDGIDGTDAEATCVACHSDTHRDPILASFALSTHATGTAYARGSSASCAQCHGNEGYIDYVTTGAVNPDGYPNVSPMSCTTCHSKHSTFDFENDGYDFALRNFDPVTLVIDNTTIIDFEGTSNMCTTCHQPRNSYPVPADDGSGIVTINSYRYGPHHGPQSTILEGIMGANISGSVGYPGVGSATHRKGASCTSCHMAESTDVAIGQHSWTPSEESCLQCHTNGAPAEVSGFAADFEALHNLLVAKNLIGEDGYVLGASGERASPSNLLLAPVKDAQAIWNYKTLEEDKSNGVHNPAYAKALLKNSIEALQN